MVQLPNPNRALVAIDCDFTTGPPGTPTANRMSLDAPTRRMAVRQIQIQRGRQYELDQSQAGTATVTVTDPLEYLNPQNGSSPFLANAGAIIPYRTLWITAYVPPFTGNIINTGVNASFDPSFETTVGGWAAGGTTTLAVSAAQHFVGSKSMLVTQGNATSTSWAWLNIPAVPGMTVTVSIYAYLTGGAHLVMTAPDGTTSATVTTQTTWTRLTLTYTTVEALDRITLAGTAVSTPTFYVDAFQVEWAASASAFTTSGPVRRSLYRGYVERFPTSYDMSGKRATHPLTAVDALAVLSRTVIAQSYKATITADNPQLYLPLSDLGPPGNFAVGGANFAKSLTPSATGSLDWAGDQFLDGTNALSIAQKNPTDPPSVGATSLYTTEWNVIGGGQFGYTSSSGMTIECWCKYVSGEVTALQVAVVPDGKTSVPDWQFLQLTTELHAKMQGAVYDFPASVAVSLASLPTSNLGYADSTWHYLALTLSGTGTIITANQDGAESPFAISGGTLTGFWGINNIHFNATTAFGDPQAQMSLCNVAIYTSDIGSTRRLAHYNRGAGYIGERSGARVTRLLGQYWAGASSVATGYAVMAPDYSYDTRTVLDVLQEIQDTEHGLAYVDAMNVVVFEDRTSRYLNQVALWVFGENPAGASPTEYPYVGYSDDYDPTYTFTQANLSRPANSAFAPMINTTSQAQFGQRILSQTVQVNTDFDLTQAGIFYLDRYAAPKVRIAKLTLDPSSNPALWPVVLSLEISQRVTVKRRSDSLTTSNDYYIEQITHNIDAENGTWTVDLQLSPVFVPVAWVLGDATYGILGTSTVPIY